MNRIRLDFCGNVHVKMYNGVYQTLYTTRAKELAGALGVQRISFYVDIVYNEDDISIRKEVEPVYAQTLDWYKIFDLIEEKLKSGEIDSRLILFKSTTFLLRELGIIQENRHIKDEYRYNPEAIEDDPMFIDV